MIDHTIVVDRSVFVDMKPNARSVWIPFVAIPLLTLVAYQSAILNGAATLIAGAHVCFQIGGLVTSPTSTLIDMSMITDFTRFADNLKNLNICNGDSSEWQIFFDLLPFGCCQG